MSPGSRGILVIRTAELPHHVSKGEYGAEDELRIIFGAQLPWPGDIAVAVETRDPAFVVDALR